MGQFVRISRHKPLLRHGRNLKRVLTACTTVKCFLQEHHVFVRGARAARRRSWLVYRGRFLRISALPRPALNEAGTSACGEQSKRRKVSFLVPLIRDSSRHKPPSSPISSLFSFSLFLSFTSISSTLQFSTTSPLLSISRPHVPAVCLSLLTLTMNTTSPCLGISETQLQELPRDLQEHEKAFRVRLECQKAVKQSKT